MPEEASIGERRADIRGPDISRVLNDDSGACPSGCANTYEYAVSAEISGATICGDCHRVNVYGAQPSYLN